MIIGQKLLARTPLNQKLDDIKEQIRKWNTVIPGAHYAQECLMPVLSSRLTKNHNKQWMITSGSTPIWMFEPEVKDIDDKDEYIFTR